jgi:hypothetical protein
MTFGTGVELTKKQQYWKAHLDALATFEGSAADYARLHDLEVKKLYVYKTGIRERLEAQGAYGAFVRVTTSSATIQTGVTVALPNGVRLSLPDLNAPGLLERLARL